MSKIKIKNLSAEINRRIKLIKTPTSVVDIGQQQGAVVNQSDYVGICLAPQSVPEGCDGATNSVRFTSQGNHQYNSGYNLEINGVFYRDFDWVGETGVSYLDYLINNFIPPNLLALDLHSNGGASYPVDWTIKSLASENLKVLISPFASPCDFQVHPDNDNPTVSSPNTSQWSFCLAPNQNQISCDGATPTADTGGIWGSIIMTVNDVPYEGANSIPGLLYIDNHGEELHNTFKNLSDQYVRVHITATELNQADHGWNENQNPTRTVDFNTGTIDFCLAPGGCEPTGFTMVDNGLFEGGSVRLDYVINAPNHEAVNVSKRYITTDIPAGTWLSEITRGVMEEIRNDYLINIYEGTGHQVTNFRFWTYRSTINGEFSIWGSPDDISSDPFTIKFVKNGFEDDLFPLLFPNAAADGITEYSAHSCGTYEFPGI